MNDEERYHQEMNNMKRHTKNAHYWALFSVVCAIVSLAATLYKVFQ